MSKQINEIENKYLISKKTFFDFMKKSLSNQKNYFAHIEQVYLFEENSSIFYDTEKSTFNITLYHEKEKASFSVIVKSEQMKEVLKDNLRSFNGIDLIKEKSTFRVRYLNGVPIFTFKKDFENIEGLLEFEVNFEDNVISNDINKVHSILSKIKSRLEKIRYYIHNDNGLIYEIDLYMDYDFITLEIEFKSDSLLLSFVEDFEFIANISKDKEYKNIILAKNKL